MKQATFSLEYESAGAEFDPTRAYRYLLWRRWAGTAGRLGQPPILWIMLNPSTADEQVLDPTLRRVEDFSRFWKGDAFEVVNLFAWRATDPRALWTVADPVGPDNDRYLVRAIDGASLVICAWGAQRGSSPRATDVKAMLAARSYAGGTVKCLGLNDDGSPKHPLYLAGSTTLQDFDVRA